MASVTKFTEKAIRNQLRHNRREIANSRNKDIDPSRVYKNYSLVDHGMNDYDFYLQRKSEVHCHKRADVKTAAGWVVTAPKDLPSNEYGAFFQAAHEFLCARYGERNCVQSIVHYDESGQPHLHWVFIPVCKDAKHGEKICAANVINKQDLRNFHGDLQRYLDAKGLHAKVKTGITKAQGGNRTVREMKKDRERQQILEHIVEQKMRGEQVERPQKIKINIRNNQQEVKQEASRWANDTAREVGREIGREIAESRWA